MSVSSTGESSALKFNDDLAQAVREKDKSIEAAHEKTT